MSTQNFYRKNADKYYVVSDRALEDGATQLLDDVREDLREAFGASNVLALEDWENSRDYPGEIFAVIDANIPGDIFRDIWIEIRPVIRAGYYSGAILDFDAKVCTYNDSININDEYLPEWLQDELEYLYENVGLAKINRPVLQNHLNEAYHNAKDKLQGIYARYSKKYVRVALFSNGEAIYREEVENDSDNTG